MKGQGKIGVFDSGLGGLYIAMAMRRLMPTYDYIYLGDTQNLPYGRRSDEVIYDLSERACRFLFSHGCELIIIACNTVSVTSLRRLQQIYLAQNHPQKRILGVVVPTLEAAIDGGRTRLGLLATQRTVASGVYNHELLKIDPRLKLLCVATPLLVPLIEEGGEKYLPHVLADYIEPIAKFEAQSIILGCTHYVAIKGVLEKLVDGKIDIIAQDELIPQKTKNYLDRHGDLERRLSQNNAFELYATDASDIFINNIGRMIGGDITVKKAVL